MKLATGVFLPNTVYVTAQPWKILTMTSNVCTCLLQLIRSKYKKNLYFRSDSC